MVIVSYSWLCACEDLSQMTIMSDITPIYIAIFLQGLNTDLISN